MRMNAGFFPVSMRTLKQFYLLYKEDLQRYRLVRKVANRRTIFLVIGLIIKNMSISQLWIRFFSQQHPWTYSLKGKKILVVHPFSETIESQYKNKKKKLFKNSEVLPEFTSFADH